jgi:putative Mg2+ transporter-C (MgtC) family protein
MYTQISSVDLIIRLLLAGFLGSLIGLERELHGRAAGLRTHILVCLGSCLLMVTSIYFFGEFGGDAARVAAGVVTGIGFLGAGTIMRFGASVVGLTTAASIWTVSAIGLAVGCGFYQAAIYTTAIVWATLALLTRVERRWLRKEWFKVMRIETKGELLQLAQIRQVLNEQRADIRDFEINKAKDASTHIIELHLQLPVEGDAEAIMHGIIQIKGVESATWQ